MDKLSGLILDVHDDPSGEILRGIFPTYDELPELIKQANYLSSEQLDGLPDDLFALVLVDEGTVLRKMACVDAGNTALAVEYFMKTAHKLPANAQAVGASNLVKACGWYGIDPPGDLQKIALGLGTALTVGGGLLSAPAIKKSVQAGKKAADAAGSTINPAVLGAGRAAR